jgi:peroxiredoxin Q/BCP
MKLLKTLSFVGSFLALSLFAHGEPLAVGAPAPVLTAVDQDGKQVNLKEVYAKGPTLVFFYPKANTGGCTKQACSLRDDWKTLQEKGVQVIGVSKDNSADQKSFEEKNQLPFRLLADTDGKVAAAFGVPVVGNVTKRQSFLIRDGKIVWNMIEKTSTATHSADVLKAVDATAKKS